MLQTWALRDPGRLALAYLGDGELITESLSYESLDGRSLQIARGLQKRVDVGERALVLCATPLEYLAAFLGCLRAGVIAVPVNPPLKARYADRLATIARDAGARFALGSEAQISAMTADNDGAPCRLDVVWLDVGAMYVEPADAPHLRRVPDGSPAYLQYTSGSSGSPKGVEVTHSALVSNLEDLVDGLGVDRDCSMLSWLPLFHDMGLVACALLPLYGGFTGYLMDPAMFVQAPAKWLRALGRYRATHTVAPNFALELCVDAIDEDDKRDIDLSRLRSIGCGAEPIRARTLSRFTEAFGGNGFRHRVFTPGYGLAEATLMVSSVRPGAATRFLRVNKPGLEQGKVREAEAGDTDILNLVSVGIAAASMDLRIVDPEFMTELPQGRVGEIWLNGPSVTRGYWNRPDETAQTFHARLANGGDLRWLRTGDLGFVHEGALYITGRLKDLVIVRGANHYPQDIEDSAQQAHPALRSNGAAAFCDEIADEERLVVVQEVKRSHLADLDVEAVVHAIRHAVAEAHDLKVHAVALLKPGGLPRTSSGKIQRALCRRFLADGTLPVVGQWSLPVEEANPVARHAKSQTPTLINASTLRDWLVRETASLLHVPEREIDPGEPLARNGMDSLAAVRLARSIADLLGRSVSPTLLYDYPSIDQLCRHLLLPDDRREPKLRNRHDEPVAVVGMACRFPGADDIEAFRRLLVEGRNGVANGESKRSAHVAGSETAIPDWPRPYGFIDNVDEFDPLFFGISPREADHMDPQQRLLLEVTWRALEHAGIAPPSLAGRDVGVFIGASNVDYLRMRRTDADRFDSYMGTGNALSIAANRISYALDLRGPSLAIDTACSSSLVAVHEACEAIRRGDAELAVAGGVNVILSPELSMVFARAGMLSPDGRCKTFDAAADGYVRAEGCGIVLLKPLSRAEADGDTVHAVIRGTAVNQDGRSNGLTAPSGPAQQAVMRRALAAAGIAPDKVGYVETHGTGTALGDPIEVGALRAVYARQAGPPCFLGAVKTNIGHLEAAAGIAGLIKTILVLAMDDIPRNLHFGALNPQIAIAGTRLRLALEGARWPAASAPRLAAVSSFGFGGTNAHAIVEQGSPVRVPVAETRGPTIPAPLLTISARTEESLRELAVRYERCIAAEAQVVIQDICYSSNIGRAHFEHRCIVEGEDADTVVGALHAFGSGQTSPTVHHIRGRRHPPRTAFLFTGQGAQYPGMTEVLFRTQPAFSRALRQCEEIARDVSGMELLSALYDPAKAEESIHDTGAMQPALFSVAYALVKMWESWGVEPHAVMGHSVGTIAAACASGVFGVEDGVRLAVERGRLMQALPPGGAMVSVAAPEEIVRAVLADYGDALSIAAFNARDRLVVSGPAEAIEAMTNDLRQRGLAAGRLPVDRAFHSALMAPMLSELDRVARSIRHGSPVVPFVTDATGKPAPPTPFDPGYWALHARAPVRFHDGMNALHEMGCDAYLEIGPGVLTALGRRCVPKTDALWLSSLGESGSDRKRITQTLATLYAAGAQIDWTGVHAGARKRRVVLPAYPFQRRRHWIADTRSANEIVTPGATRATSSRSALTGERLDTASKTEAIYAYRLSRSDPAYLTAHKVLGATRAPAALLLGLVVDAGTQYLSSATLRIRDFAIESALELPDDSFVQLQVLIDCGSDSACRFTLARRIAYGDGARWVALATGSVESFTVTGNERIDLEALRSACNDSVVVEPFYERLSRVGLEYGRVFRAVRTIARGNTDALARIVLDAEADGLHGSGPVNPILLDACFQSLGTLVPEALAESLYLPMAIEHFELRRPLGSAIQCHTRLTDANKFRMRGDLTLISDDGDVVASVRGFSLVRPGAEKRAGDTHETPNAYWESAWQPEALDAAALATGTNSAPSLPMIEERVKAGLARHDNMERIEMWLQVAPSLDVVSGRFAHAAIAQLYGDPLPGASFTADALAAKAGIASLRRPLLNRILEILVDDGSLRHDNHGRYVMQRTALADPKAALEELRRCCPESEAEIALLSRCGPSLAGVLAGRVDPMSLLFRDGDLALTSRLYRDSPGARVMNDSIATALVSAQQQRRRDARLRVLEIGAGTGGTTSAVLSALEPGQVDYCFTDISPLFVAQARKRWSGVSGFAARVLDIERPPGSQDLSAPEYDVVVASNVLHATADLRTTLRHVRQLLNPGGLLLLVEGTRRQNFLDVVFGLMDGWWRFADRDLRGDYPLVEAQVWRDLLTAEGFRAPSIFTPQSTDLRETSAHSLFVAQLPVEAAASPSLMRAVAGHWIVLAEAGGPGAVLAGLLREAGQHCTLACPGQHFLRGGQECELCPTDSGQIEHLLRETCAAKVGPLRGIVQMWDVTGRAPDETRDDDVQASTGRACAATLALVHALQRLSPTTPPRLWLVTRGAQVATRHDGAAGIVSSVIVGMGKTIALEHPEWRCASVDLDPTPQEDEITRLHAEITSDSVESQVAFRGAERRVCRLVPGLRIAGPGMLETAAIQSGQAYELVSTLPGQINALRLRAAARRAPGPDEVEIEVIATGLNFRDLLVALGNDVAGGVSDPLGGECSGVITRIGEDVRDLAPGDRVAALVMGAFAAYATVSSQRVARVPAGMRVADAASIPSNFVTAQYALEDVARVSDGDTVLVHAAAGGTGSAAVQVARRLGAKVVATAAPWKWPYLRRVGIQRVSSSRTAQFAADAGAASEGRGVDVVVNSLTGDFIANGFSVLRPGGTFIELGKTAVLAAEAAAELRSDVVYRPVDIVSLAQCEPPRVQSLLRSVMARFERGEYTLPHLERFAIDDVQEAFRYMRRAAHIGKIVVDHRTGPPGPSFDRDGAYLVTGGGGDLGRLVGHWLAKRGAGGVVLMGRNPPDAPTQASLDAIRGAGADASVEIGDVGNRAQLARVLEAIDRSGRPLRGVIHAAGVLDDGTLAKQNRDSLERVLWPKVAGAWNLHLLTRDRALDAFVLFSSVAALLGSPGQANHAAANAFLDALAQYRKVRGLPGLSIQWGAWSELGAAARIRRQRGKDAGGVGQVTPAFGLEALDRVFAHHGAVIAVAPLDVRALAASALGRMLGTTLETLRPPHASDLPVRTLRDEIDMTPPDERRPRLEAALVARIADSLGIDTSRSSIARRGFFELGMDSLASMEVRNSLQQELGVALPSTLMFDYPTIEDLVDYLYKEIFAPATNGSSIAGAIGASRTAHESDELSEDQVVTELDRELSNLRASP